MLAEYEISGAMTTNSARLFHYSRGKHQILLVHGFNSSEKIWLPRIENGNSFSVAKELASLGFGCWLLRLSNPVQGNIEYLAMNDLFQACELIQVHSGEKVRSIVAHSMGGIIARFLISQVGKKDSLKDLRNVVLLAVPNHGVSLTYFLKQAQKINDLIPNIIKVIEERTSVAISTRAYYQLLEVSPIIRKLNERKRFLHPQICWYNAIASKDVIVPKESASFRKEELEKNGVKCFEQKVFRATHMYNSLQLLDQVITPFIEGQLSGKPDTALKKILQQALETLDYVIAPPIYRSIECFKWWIRHLQN